MGQIFGLIIILIVWVLISLFKKQAYKQQQTAHKIHKSNVTAGHNLKDSFNNQTDVNLNKLFKILPVIILIIQFYKKTNS